MHELSLVMELVAQVEREVAAAGESGPVVRLELAIGRLSGVHADAVRFAFDVVKQDTLLENAELVIDQPAACCACRSCRSRATMDNVLAACPSCGSPDITIEGGRELLLNSIEVE